MRYIIVSWISDFEFPLAEALRKQIWWKAIEKSKENYNVEIYIFGSKQKKEYKKNNITIKQFQSSNLKLEFTNRDIILHFITGIIGIRHLESFKIKAHKKFLTLTDNCIFGENSDFWRKTISLIIPLLFDKIIVYSNFQLKQLIFKYKVKKEFPLLPSIMETNILKNKIPTLFYMGHFSYFKGVDFILDTFEILIKEYDDLQLVLANSGLKGDDSLIKRVNKLYEKYPNNIILKGKVNPIEELSKAWIYLYPFKTPCKTMTYALSLYESLKCNTPFIACDVGANREFFDKKYLISSNNLDELVNKTRIFINEQNNI